MSAFSQAVDEKIVQWRESGEWPNLDRKSVDEAWGDVARELKKYARGDRSQARDRDKLVTIAAFCSLGWGEKT